MSKKKLSYNDIGRVLREYGCKEVEDIYGLDGTLYEMSVGDPRNEDAVLLEVSCSYDDFLRYGDFGIMGLNVSKHCPNEPPFNRNELEDMLEILDAAEGKLLTIGVPFTERYCFFKAKSIFRRNNSLRKKFNIPATIDEISRQQHQPEEISET